MPKLSCPLWSLKVEFRINEILSVLSDFSNGSKFRLDVTTKHEDKFCIDVFSKVTQDKIGRIDIEFSMEPVSFRFTMFHPDESVCDCTSFPVSVVSDTESISNILRDSISTLMSMDA